MNESKQKQEPARNTIFMVKHFNGVINNTAKLNRKSEIQDGGCNNVIRRIPAN